MEDKNQSRRFHLDRRGFLKVAGFGAASLAIPGIVLAQNTNQTPVSGIKSDDVVTDILVIGGGMAGVFAAIKARETGLDVTLVSKGAVGTSGMTPFANTFMVFDPKKGHDKADSLKATQIMAKNTANLAYVEMLFDDGMARYNDLKSWGAIGPTEFGPILRSRVEKSGVRIIDRVMMTDLIKRDGRIVGAVGFPLDEDRMLVIRAKATIMCAGAGGYKPAGYPISSLTHDGDAMAYRVGAEIGGKEFIDFHITAMDYPADVWGAWDSNWNGLNRTNPPNTRRMRGPRNQGPRVHAGDVPMIRRSRRGPEPPGGTPQKGLIGREIVGNSGVGLGTHKSEGIWPADANCASQLPGLYAAGDALASMQCGSSYTGLGASCAGSAVQGARAGLAAARYARGVGLPDIPKARLDQVKQSIFEPRNREKGFRPSWVTQMLQNTMTPYYVLMVKEQKRLEAALTNIEFLRDHLTPMMIAADLHELRKVHETRNMLLNAEMKLRAGLFRTESRGSHFREDYPEPNDKKWLGWVLVKWRNGRMVCRKEPIPQKWVVTS